MSQVQQIREDTHRFRRRMVIVLGIAVMSFFVVVVNRVFWRPLYAYAERKFRID